MTGTLPPLLDFVLGGGTPGMKVLTSTYGSNATVPGARGSDTHKLPVVVNLLAPDVHRLDMRLQIAI
ncbi:hypothetical protein TNCV_797101 [Trichonephila clavipes]|uniref:Uncharacterized protein n=1 Tax=Trichonephila clavipes TaxID=2585209 RepID=A0A8X6WJS3_TRICX|nr:hypothetical protein TNCV_797101 [Trichonephila clavipes]